jgi:GPI mannosyltransferase 2
MPVHKTPLALFALSRIAVLACATFSYLFVSPNDSSTSLLVDFSSPLKHLVRWDAIFMQSIVVRGYTSEKSTVFFPLFPLLSRFISSSLRLSPETSSFLLSNFFFLLSIHLLFLLTSKMYGEPFASKAAFFYAFNPASIIYSSAYTESTFACFFMLALYLEFSRKPLLSLLSLMCCALTRSNGVLLAPIMLYTKTHFYLRTLVLMGVSATIQMYWRVKMFSFLSLGTSPYTYVQNKYWNQGFLNFYGDKKNIPNVMVGGPFVLISIFILFRVFSHGAYKKNSFCLYLGGILAVQTFLSIFFIHMNMHFRFVSFNPLIYWEFTRFSLESRGYVRRCFLFAYVSFCLSYGALFGAYFPPA